jgi:NitT/TauT family transport system substrate-binding protein
VKFGSWVMKFVSLRTGALAVVLAVACASASRTALAESDQVRLSRQYGVGYLPLMVMEQQQLIEKHARADGLGSVKVSWVTFTGGSTANDALLSGSVDFAGGGIGAFITLWDKTGGRVKSPGALSSYPMFLNTTNAAIHSIKDFTDKDKIALPATKISPQAVTLQVAAAATWGAESYDKLDRLTITRGHPDAVQELLSGISEIDAHFTTPPFQYRELQDPKVHTILNSNDIWGGALTANILWATSDFANANPKLFKAVDAALKEAIDWVNANHQKAAELYVTIANDRGGVQPILKMLDNPDIQFTQTPQNMMKFIDFKVKTGTLKHRPESWKDLFFPNVWQLPGS